MEPRIICADRLHDGLLIAFSDGKEAFFPAGFLYEGLSRIEHISDEPGPEKLGEVSE